MIQLIKRNLKLYFRDRMSVFFSLLSVMIVIGLYALFLADIIKGGGDFSLMSEADTILDTWILAGILSIVSLTTTLASYGVMVNDKCSKIMKDFYASSMKRWKLVVAYILAACIIGFIMSVCTLILGEGYIIANGGTFMGVQTLLKVLGVSVISVICGSSMMFLLSSLLKTTSAFSNASTVIGTLSGFIMGIYMPIGVLPEFAQSIVKFFPLTHGTSIFRQILLDDLLTSSFDGAPVEVLQAFKEEMGIVMQINGTTLTMNMHMMIMLGCALLCVLLSVLIFRRKKK